MATSGVADFNLDLADAIEEAGERCGYEIRTGNDFRTARRSMNLLFADWANRGVNLWTLEQLSIPLLQGVATYNLPLDTVDVTDAVVRTGTGPSQADLTISRIPFPIYATIPNKTSPGRPIQMFIERLNAPRINVWPVPDQTGTYTLVYWRLRRLQNAGSGGNTPDLPFRFLPAMIAGLAYYLSMKLPGGLERMGALKMQYDEAWQLAADEDRDKSPARLVPSRGY